MAGDICVCSTSYGEGRNKGTTGPGGTLHHYRFGEATTLCGHSVGHHCDGTMADARRAAKAAGLPVYPCAPCTEAVKERDSSGS